MTYVKDKYRNQLGYSVISPIVIRKIINPIYNITDKRIPPILDDMIYQKMSALNINHIVEDAVTDLLRR